MAHITEVWRKAPAFRHGDISHNYSYQIWFN